MEKERGTTSEMKVQTGLRAGIWLAIGAGLGDLQISPGNMAQIDLTPSVQSPSVSALPATASASQG